MRNVAVRVVLGNDSGLRKTIGAQVLLYGSRIAGPVKVRRNRAASALAAQGWARFEHHIASDVVDVVADRFAHLIDDDRVSQARGRLEPDAHRYLVDPHRHIPEVAALLTPPVQEAIEAYYGSHFRVRSVRAYRNRSFEHTDGAADVYGNVWHEDPDLVCDLRYFVYLSETVSAANGALMSFDRRTSRRLLRSGYLGPGRAVGPARRFLQHPTGTTVHGGRRGFGVLIDPQRCVHRAGTCLPGQQRDVVQFWITPDRHPLPPDWSARLAPDAVFHREARASDG
jgi:hypothetical protein